MEMCTHLILEGSPPYRVLLLCSLFCMCRFYVCSEHSQKLKIDKTAKIKLVNSSILKERRRRDRTMLVNKLHIGCSVVYAEGNKKEDAGYVRCEASILRAYQIT